MMIQRKAHLVHILPSVKILPVLRMGQFIHLNMIVRDIELFKVHLGKC